MEFYLYNKDDRKSSTLVNLGTTFKMNDVNYIVYYNKQVEKSSIDIYIGKISYGDQCLVINKIDDDKQNDFLTVVKSILANNNPETEFGDYDNIIDTATIVLESVQKIQIPTTSLDILKNYHKNIADTSKEEIKSESTMEATETTQDVINNNSTEVSVNQPNVEEQNKLNQNTDVVENKEINTNNTDISSEENTMVFNDKLGNLDNVLNEKDKPKEKKPKKAISTPILILLIVVVIGSAILYFVGNGME